MEYPCLETELLDYKAAGGNYASGRLQHTFEYRTIGIRLALNVAENSAITHL